MSHPYEKEQQVAVNAVRQAAGLCRKVQSQITPDILEKKDKSPVTVADFGTQAVICQAIDAAFPDDPIIGEEDATELRDPSNESLLQQVAECVNHAISESTAHLTCNYIDRGGAKEYSHRFWTLDPIDGTKGFLRGDQYAIALALIVDGKIVVAALGCPNLTAKIDGENVTGLIYTAVKGQGTTMLPIDDANHDGVPVHVTETKNTADAYFCESVESGHTSHSDAAKIAEELKITKDPFRIDSQCKYAAIAQGHADIYLRLPTRPGYVERIWDHAAGVLVVTEAGGTVTDIYGQPLEFTHGAGLEKNKGVIVTNGHLHDKVIDAIEAVGVQPA